MAKIILGTIVTSVRGSIGGNTFKKTATGFSMGKKSFGASVNRLTQNTRLGNIASIFQAWSLLSDINRTAWNNSALLFQFPDKNGNLKYLNGRQLFTKLNCQVIQKSQRIDSPVGINSTNSTLYIDNLQILNNVDLVQFDIIQEYGISDIYVYAEKMLNSAQTPNIKKAKFLTYLASPANGQYIITAEFLAVYPILTVGDIYNITIVPVNNFGFRGVAYSAITIVESI